MSEIGMETSKRGLWPVDRDFTMVKAITHLVILSFFMLYSTNDLKC